MDAKGRRIIRVLSNNAVLTGDASGEMVLVGRGIGFGRSVGDPIDESSIQQRYVELDPERVQMLSWITSLGTGAAETISRAIDLSVDALGDLHPAAYVLLMDHIAFAIERTDGGETIDNPLLPQIREMFPLEFHTAQEVVRLLNEQFNIQLPDGEAAFIALHLNAARSGETVKQPLQRANRLAGLVTEICTQLGATKAAMREAITHDLVAVNRRVHYGVPRQNRALLGIRRDLPEEFAIAALILCRLLRLESLPKNFEGEAAFLAVQAHGWRMDCQPATRKEKA